MKIVDLFNQYAKEEAILEALQQTSLIDEVDWQGRNALHLLVMQQGRLKNTEQIISHLISEGIDVNQPDLEGCPPLFYLDFNPQNKTFIKHLLEAGVKINFRDSYGWNLLHHIAMVNIDYDIIAFLLEQGLNKNCLSSKDRDYCFGDNQYFVRSQSTPKEIYWLRREEWEILESNHFSDPDILEKARNNFLRLEQLF